MYKKIVFGIGIIAAVAFILIAAVQLLTWKPQQSPSSSVPSFGSQFSNPGSSGTPAATSTSGKAASSTITILNFDHKVVTVKDFLHDEATVEEIKAPGYYELGYHYAQAATDTIAVSNPPYLIEYIHSTDYFNIDLLQEPLGAARIAAEQYLADYLGLGQDDLCRLKYAVYVPTWVNTFYAGRNLGFSFCPDATALPK